MLTHTIDYEVFYLPGYKAAEAMTSAVGLWVQDDGNGDAMICDGSATKAKVLGVNMRKSASGEEMTIARAPSIVGVKLGENVTAYTFGKIDMTDGTTILATDASDVEGRFLTAGSDGETVPFQMMDTVTVANVSLIPTGS